MTRVSETSTARKTLASGDYRRERWLAGGGIAGALLASACCVLPLVLFALGIGGAWIGELTALAPYKLWFWTAGALFVIAGFVAAWRGRRSCRIDSECPPPPMQRAIHALLWVAALLLALVAVWPLLLPVIMAE